MDKFKKFLKSYFVSPGAGINPVAFFYTPMVPVSVIFFLNSLLPVLLAFSTASSSGTMTLLFFIVATFYICVCIYTYAFLTDYVLFLIEPINRFSFRRFIFLRSVIFSRNIGATARAAYEGTNEEWIIKNNRIRENKLERAGAAGCVTFIVFPVIKFIIACIMYPLFLISPLLHPFILKKFDKAMEERFNVNAGFSNTENEKTVDLNTEDVDLNTQDFTKVAPNFSVYSELDKEQIEQVRQEVFNINELQELLEAIKNNDINKLTFENIISAIAQVPEEEMLNSVRLSKRFAMYEVMKGTIVKSTLESLNNQLMSEGYFHNTLPEDDMELYLQIRQELLPNDKVLISYSMIDLISNIDINARNTFYKHMKQKEVDGIETEEDDYSEIIDDFSKIINKENEKNRNNPLKMGDKTEVKYASVDFYNNNDEQLVGKANIMIDNLIRGEEALSMLDTNFLETPLGMEWIIFDAVFHLIEFKYDEEVIVSEGCFDIYLDNGHHVEQTEIAIITDSFSTAFLHPGDRHQGKIIMHVPIGESFLIKFRDSTIFSPDIPSISTSEAWYKVT